MNGDANNSPGKLQIAPELVSLLMDRLSANML